MYRLVLIVNTSICLITWRDCPELFRPLIIRGINEWVNKIFIFKSRSFWIQIDTLIHTAVRSRPGWNLQWWQPYKLVECLMDILIYLWLKHDQENHETQRFQTKVRRRKEDQKQKRTSPKLGAHHWITLSRLTGFCWEVELNQEKEEIVLLREKLYFRLLQRRFEKHWLHLSAIAGGSGGRAIDKIDLERVVSHILNFNSPASNHSPCFLMQTVILTRSHFPLYHMDLNLLHCLWSPLLHLLYTVPRLINSSS